MSWLKAETVFRMRGKKPRSAVTGRYVKDSFASRHPRTTVWETKKKRSK